MTGGHKAMNKVHNDIEYAVMHDIDTVLRYTRQCPDEEVRDAAWRLLGAMGQGLLQVVVAAALVLDRE
jgi:hypothetical protein